jgi:methionyl aminopeptidase
MIIIKSRREIEKMRVSGRLTAELMELLRGMIKPGLRIIELDLAAEDFCRGHGVRAAFKGYKGYPAHICVSINEVVVHGIPGNRVLSEGDIAGIDVGVEYEGYYGDMARTFNVGRVNGEKEKLIEATCEALTDAVSMTRPGNRLSDISGAIERRVKRDGFSVVRDFVGHGIGALLHEDPQIPNFVTSHSGPLLKEGMTFAIEVMANTGTHEIEVLSDGWTAVTKDGKPSAHFEDTVAITENGAEILTCLKEKRR